MSKHIIHKLEQERVRLINELNQTYEDAYQMEGKWQDAVKQRDQYKAENKKIKEEMKNLKEESNITVFCALMEENEQLKRKAQAYDKMMTGEMGELYKKAEAFDEVLAIHNMDEEYEDTIGDYEQYIDKLVKNYLEDE